MTEQACHNCGSYIPDSIMRARSKLAKTGKPIKNSFCSLKCCGEFNTKTAKAKMKGNKCKMCGSIFDVKSPLPKNRKFCKGLCRSCYGCCLPLINNNEIMEINILCYQLRKTIKQEEGMYDK